MTVTLHPPVHHMDKRRPCIMCTTRLFTYATAVDDDTGQELHYLCTKDYHRVIGQPICDKCQRPIEQDASGAWTHTLGDPLFRGTTNHVAAPEVVPDWETEHAAMLRNIGRTGHPR